MNNHNAGNQKKVLIKELTGSDHEEIIPGRLANFFFALSIASVLGTIFSFILSEHRLLNFKFLLPFIGTSILFTLLFIVCLAVVFRYIREVYLAIFISTVSYSVLNVAVRHFFGPTPNWLDTIIFAWLWYFLVLTALHISLQKIKQIVMALVTGYFSACVLHQIARIIIYKISIPEIEFNIGYESVSLLLAALEAVIFAGLLWMGLHQRWARWQFASVTAAGYGAPLPGAGDVLEHYELAELKKAIDTRMIQKILRPAGLGSIVFGLIAIFLGILSAKDMPINSLLAVIGSLLLVEGIWCALDPKPVGLVVDGIALIILGAWNIIVTISNLSVSSGSSLGGFVVLGIWQISWGIQSIKRYKQFSYLSKTTMNPESFQNLENTIADIKQASETGSEQIIEFQVKRVFNKTSLKGKAIKNMVLFVGSRKELFMEKITDIKIIFTKADRDKSLLNATLHISGQVFSGEISQLSLDRYTHWVSGAQNLQG